MFNLRSLFIPWGTRKVDAVELWEVRWTSRHGQWHTDIRPECEVFPIKEDAEAFAQALKNSFALVKHTGCGTKVSIEHKGASFAQGKTGD